MKARARKRAAIKPPAFPVCAPFVIKPVAVPPAELFGAQLHNATKGLSGGKTTVFPLFARFYAE
jgi:hypothetical protein